jgi:nucleolar protein 12
MTDYVPGQLSSLFLGGVQTSSPEKKKKRNKATKTGGVNSTLEQLFATSVGQ